LLYLLAKIAGAKRVLEIGTLGGYSTTWLARALPADGLLVTLELELRHAEVARRSLDQAALAPAIDLRVGPAADSLRDLIRAATAPSTSSSSTPTSRATSSTSTLRWNSRAQAHSSSLTM
jgi:predicted O-methyltransferase YrrM